MDNQTLIQKKIALAQSEHASAIVELMKDCMVKTPLLGETEWQTIVNAITLDTQSNMIRAMVDLIEEIKQGTLHDPK
jgi:hypothetical protein